MQYKRGIAGSAVQEAGKIPTRQKLDVIKSSFLRAISALGNWIEFILSALPARTLSGKGQSTHLHRNGVDAPGHQIRD